LQQQLVPLARTFGPFSSSVELEYVILIMINENYNNKKKAYTDCCDLHFLNIGPPLIGSAPEVNGRGSACHGDFLVATTGECIFHIGLICSWVQ